jgi:hypothetical protein
LNGDPVPCEEILIRLVSRKGDILPTGEPEVGAFILRRGEERLSFFRRSISDIGICKSALTKPRGAATLHTGRIRNGDYPHGRHLNVVEAEGEGTDIPGHAALVGLPDPITEYEEAERVASILRLQSRGMAII